MAEKNANEQAINGQVIDFARARKEATLLPARREGTRYCRHRNVSVDSHARAVWCRSCDAPLDPFTVLWQYANDERAFMHEDLDLRKQRDQLAEEVAQLRREEKNVKARIRRWEKKERG